MILRIGFVILEKYEFNSIQNISIKFLDQNKKKKDGVCEKYCNHFDSITRVDEKQGVFS